MLTRKTIEAYHSRSNIEPVTPKIGIELELFCIDNTTLRPVPYQAPAGQLSIQALFDYLKAHEGYTESSVAKTFGLQKNGSKLTLEPGAQIEFCSVAYHDPETLFREFWAYCGVLKRLSDHFNISWLDTSCFPTGNASDVTLLPSSRCEIIDRYWQRTGTLGRDLMRYTTSLHLSLDYADAHDLAKKVERALFLKPIFLFLSASSRIRHGKDTGYRSFRTMIYLDTDGPRTGTPGLEALWENGYWTLDGYIEKVLAAPAIFSVGANIYEEGPHQPFKLLLDKASFDDYLAHLATIYTDIRIRQYLEVRYLDNPGIRLLPGIVLLFSTLLYDDIAWHDFRTLIPYTLQDVPHITALLNRVSDVSNTYWEHHLLRPVTDFIATLQTRVSPTQAEHLGWITDRAINYKKRDELPNIKSEQEILVHFKDSFPF